MKILIISIILSILQISLNAQSTYVNIKKYITTSSEGKYASLSKSDYQKYYSDKGVIHFLGNYQKKTTSPERKAILRLVGKIGRKHTDIKSRQKAVNILLEIVLGDTLSITNQVPAYLKKFAQADFDKLAKEKVISIIQANKPHTDKYIMIAGFLQLKNELQAINSTRSTKQAKDLALVRCGDEKRKVTMLKNVKKLPIDDDFVYRIAPLLIYTHQKELIDYLLEIIMMDKKLCHPSGADVKGNILCGYRIMEFIAPLIIDFPLEVNRRGDVITDDYEKALMQTRQWIKTNKANYKIEQSHY